MDLNRADKSVPDGFCGWFGCYGDVAAAERTLRAMARTRLTGSVHASPGSDAAMLLIPSTPSGALFSNDAVYAVIDGDPEWSDTSLADLARQRGHGAALAEAYRLHGGDLFRHLHGPFSIAVFDRKTRKGLAAIDRMGLKTLCYARPSPDLLVFGNRVGAVVNHPSVDTRLSYQALYDYQVLWRIPAPLTIYDSIQKLSPAQVLEFDANGMRLRHYWQMPYDPKGRTDLPQLKEELFGHLNAAIDRTTAGENAAKTGAFLSGGLDSSTVAGLLRQRRGADVRAFTIAFNEDGYDETEYAIAAAQQFDIEHIVYEVTPDDVCDVLPHLNEPLDEPYGNSSCVPAFYCAHVARQNGVDLLLAGDGGDETFAGNSWYPQMRTFERYQSVPKLLRRFLLEPAVAHFPGRDRFWLTRKAQRYIEQANVPMPDRTLTPEAALIGEMSDILSPDLLNHVSQTHPTDQLGQIYRDAASPDILQRMMHLDLKITLADSDLVKVTRMCELAGIRVKFPLLDERLAEFSAKISPDLMMKNNQERYFYKRAMEGFLPDKIITKTKHGFGLPFGKWYRKSARMQEIAYEALDSIKGRGFIRPEYIRTLLEKQTENQHHHFAGPIWDLTVLELWFQRHVDGREREPARAHS